MAEKSYLDAVGDYLEKLNEQGLAIRFGVIFGSWAKGNPDKWSDIDLMVISPRFDGPRNRRDVDLLWHLAARIDSRIEPIPCGEKQWEDDDSSAIVEIARREGKRVDFFPGPNSKWNQQPNHPKKLRYLIMIITLKSWFMNLEMIPPACFIMTIRPGQCWRQRQVKPCLSKQKS